MLRPLSAALQEKGMDLVECLKLVDAVISVLEDMRANYDQEFAELMAKAAAMAAQLNTELRKPRLPSRAAHRSTAGQDLTVEGYFRASVFVPAVDAVLADTKDRFGEHQRKAFLLSQLLPANVNGVTWEQLEPVFAQYASLIEESAEQLRAEFRVWSAMWTNRSDAEIPVTAIGALNECSRRTFPAVHRLLEVLAVLPVTTAEAERLFSKVTRTLTALLATMGEDRLEALILCQAHRERLPATEAVVDRFATAGARRLNFRLSL